MPGRNVLYYQTINDQYSSALVGAPVSHVYVAAVHVHEDKSFWLNDDPIEGTRYQSLWQQWVPRWIGAGKTVLLLLGGAGNGTWDTIMKDIHGTPPGGRPATIATIQRLLQTHKLAGVDLDVETYAGDLVELAETINGQLRRYIPGITLTMSPVVGQLGDVDTIQRNTAGTALNWANVQMYCDFVRPDQFASTYDGYLRTYTHLDAAHLVAGVDLDPDCVTSIPLTCTYLAQIRKLAANPQFGGTAMWEYADAFTNPPAQPWPACAAAALLGKGCSACPA
jgi:hypothetical protein